MKITHGAMGIVIATVLLSSACNKKADEGAGGAASAATSTTTAAPTGIKGTVKGKPFAGKMALVSSMGEGDAKLYIKPQDATCSLGDLMGGPEGSTHVEVIAPFKQGLTPFSGDKAYANLVTKIPRGSSNTDTSTGEIEWIKLPTAAAKGLARVKVIKDPDTKVEGTMEVTFCK